MVIDIYFISRFFCIFLCYDKLTKQITIMIKLTSALQATALVSALVIAPNANAAKKKSAPQRPNVLLINIDDLGYGDPSCYGGTLYETPNIDRIASQGVRFTDGYVTAPVSGVSRIGLLTGSHQQRYGMQWNQDQWRVIGRDGERILPESQMQIQTAFREAGYKTAMAGKIGFQDHQPFDEYFSFTQEGANSYPNAKGEYAGVDGCKEKKNETITWVKPSDGEHLTDRCGRQCTEFIKANKENPFFFYMAFNAPHTPLHPNERFRDDVSHIKSPVAQAFAAMVLGVDYNIGKILDCLEKEGLRDNTIVILLSDNGPANPFHLSLSKSWWIEGAPMHLLGQRAGLNGFKGLMWEAGIRVPYIISWKGHLPEGETYSEPVSTLDIFPTLCAAAHVKTSKTTRFDGTNLLPYFMSDYKADAPHEELYWYANRMGAVRMGKWKMLIEEDYHYLFNLENDKGETKNVMRDNPAVMIEMLDKYFAFRNQMPAYRNPFIRPIDIRDEGCKELKIVDAF